MHNLFKERLKDSYGESRFVIAINIDVRNFSVFSKSVDSAESALFIKKIFQNILTSYFLNASFFKSTGDGLIIIYDIVEEKLNEISNNVIENSLRLIKDFSTLCLNEPMVNFTVPDKCGIGISRGPATCLRTTDSILDYFGHTLNIASRLMECAKPTGIIIDSKFGIDLLGEELKKQFDSCNIFLAGNRNPMQIWFTKTITKISQIYLKPTENEIGQTITEMKFKDIKTIGGNFRFLIPSKPVNLDDISIEISHLLIKNNQVSKAHRLFHDFKKFDYIGKSKEHIIRVDFDEVIALLSLKKVRPNMDVRFVINYPK